MLPPGEWLLWNQLIILYFIFSSNLSNRWKFHFLHIVPTIEMNCSIKFSKSTPIIIQCFFIPSLTLRGLHSCCYCYSISNPLWPNPPYPIVNIIFPFKIFSNLFTQWVDFFGYCLQINLWRPTWDMRCAIFPENYSRIPVSLRNECLAHHVICGHFGHICCTNTKWLSATLFYTKILLLLGAP